jgi:hypothetical protein
MTRADVLQQIVGRRVIADQFKSAPQRNLESFRTKLVGQAGFEGVGSAPTGERYVRLDTELDTAPAKERVTKLEKALNGVEF